MTAPLSDDELLAEVTLAERMGDELSKEDHPAAGMLLLLSDEVRRILSELRVAREATRCDCRIPNATFDRVQRYGCDCCGECSCHRKPYRRPVP